MSPYFNDGYEKTNTDSDMVLVSMWPWTAWPWVSGHRRILERGMVVTFRYFAAFGTWNGVRWIAN